MNVQVISNERYNKSVDWYALGVLIFEMLTGLPPFYEPGLSLLVLYDKILRGPACIAWPPDASPDAADLVLRLMERDPSKRFGNMQHGAGDVFAHPWFAVVDWEKMLRMGYDPPYVPRVLGDGDASA